MLVGPKDFIKKARWFRKLFGGGMRQTGVLAASAAYALTHNFPQLPRVHALARRLEAGLEEIGATILSKAETCMVSGVSCNALRLSSLTMIGLLRSNPRWRHLRRDRRESFRASRAPRSWRVAAGCSHPNF